MFERRINIMDLPSYEESQREVSEGQDTSVIVVTREYNNVKRCANIIVIFIFIMIFYMILKSLFRN